MARPLRFQIVEKARALIADERHWCRGELARDVNGVGVCPTADSAMKRCGLGALITAAYQITNDQPWGSRSCDPSLASTLRQRHCCPCQRHKGSCGCACAIRRGYSSDVRALRLSGWPVHLSPGPVPKLPSAPSHPLALVPLGSALCRMASVIFCIRRRSGHCGCRFRDRILLRRTIAASTLREPILELNNLRRWREIRLGTACNQLHGLEATMGKLDYFKAKARDLAADDSPSARKLSLHRHWCSLQTPSLHAHTCGSLADLAGGGPAHAEPLIRT